jgi:hypothetical protein
LKCYWNEALDNYRTKNRGRIIGKLQFPKLLAEAWMKAATPRVAAAGVKSMGICNFIPDIVPETTLAPRVLSQSVRYTAT